MFNLQPISKSRTYNRNGEYSVTADKYNRLCLNTELQKALLRGKNDLYLFWDEESRTIGISVEAFDSEHIPYRFDKRGCTSAGDFFTRCEIDNREGAIKFLYDGKERDIFLFREAGFRKTHSFKQEKNGNLERTKN